MENLVERVDGRIQTILFDFDGHQIEVRLLSGIKPAFQVSSYLGADQIFSAAQSVEVSRIVHGADVFAHIVLSVSNHHLALFAGRFFVQRSHKRPFATWRRSLLKGCVVLHFINFIKITNFGLTLAFTNQFNRVLDEVHHLILSDSLVAFQSG